MKALNWSSAAAAMAVAALLSGSADSQEKASADLIGKDGKSVGSATLTETPNGVLIRLDLTGVPAGTRAFHIHGTGKCDPPDFQSAGGHFNPDEAKHGVMSHEGPHAGDMPNLHIPEGVATFTIEVLNMMVTLEKGEPHALLGDDGTALVIHEGVDDYQTDPTGDAGGRVACGVIQ